LDLRATAEAMDWSRNVFDYLESTIKKGFQNQRFTHENRKLLKNSNKYYGFVKRMMAFSGTVNANTRDDRERQEYLLKFS